MSTHHKPLINVLLEAMAKRNNINLDLKNVDLQDIRKPNLRFLYLLVTKEEQTRNRHELKLQDFMANEMIDIIHRNQDSKRDILFPNFRPADHFAKGEEVYVEVLSFSHDSSGVGKQIGFIKTVIEEDGRDGPLSLRYKVFNDLLPNTHHMSSNNSGYSGTNYGRLLKISEYEALKVLVNTDPEFVDLFRANGTGSFHNLALYDITKYDKKLMDEESNKKLIQAARNCN